MEVEWRLSNSYNASFFAGNGNDIFQPNTFSKVFGLTGNRVLFDKDALLSDDTTSYEKHVYHSILINKKNGSGRHIL